MTYEILVRPTESPYEDIFEEFHAPSDDVALIWAYFESIDTYLSDEEAKNIWETSSEETQEEIESAFGENPSIEDIVEGLDVATNQDEYSTIIKITNLDTQEVIFENSYFED